MRPERRKKKSDKALKVVDPTTAAEAPSPQPDAPKLQIPSILLEGDAPSASPVSGPGQRYALSPTPLAPAKESREALELPEAYGTQRLYLTARDPHWIYAHWDLTREQLKHYNSLSTDRHLVLRIYKDKVTDAPHSEVHVHPESRDWLLTVDQGGTDYIGELGYYHREKRQWTSLSISTRTHTPPDGVSNDVSVWFETLPADLQFDHLLRLVKSTLAEDTPLLEGVRQLRLSNAPGLPNGAQIHPDQGNPQLVRVDEARRVWLGSLEITELLRFPMQEELSSAAASQFSSPGSAMFSPLGGMEGDKGFWFKVNAELVVYGATDPNAQVTLGGRPVQLRPDGTFSYRFALPDGEYDVPAVATSAEGTDSRSAELHFSRTTQYRGEVGEQPQDPNLPKPLPEDLG